jgi:hypothetical protein
MLVTLSGIDKHTSLLFYRMNYGRKKFYVTDPWCDKWQGSKRVVETLFCVIKHFAAVTNATLR